MKKTLFLLSLVVGLSTVTYTAEIEFTRAALDHDDLTVYNFEAIEFTNFQRAFEDSLSAFFQNTKSGQELRIIQTFDPNLTPFFSFSAKPMLNDSVRHALQKKLMKIAPLYSKYIDCSYSYSLIINGGYLKRDATFLPYLESPRQTRQNTYALANMPDIYALIQDWIRSGALPILTEILLKNPENLYANSTTKLDLPKNANEAATILLEMKEFDRFYFSSLNHFKTNPQLLPAIKILRLASKGQFDYAQLLTAMLYQFESRNSVLRYLLDELSWRLAYYFRHEGIMLSAIEFQPNETQKKVYIDSMLKVNPNSSAALYASIDPEANHLVSTYPYNEAWNRYAESNPMYVLTRKATEPTEAYTNHLRTISYDLFMDPETIADAHENYAELSLQISAFNFAADLYWMLMNAVIQKQDNEFSMSNPTLKDEERATQFENYQFKYAFALYEMGYVEGYDKRMKKKFKAYKKTLAKKMKKSEAYKTFKS